MVEGTDMMVSIALVVRSGELGRSVVVDFATRDGQTNVMMGSGSGPGIGSDVGIAEGEHRIRII